MGLDDFLSGDVEEKDDDEESNQKSSGLSSKIQSTTTTQDTDVGRCPSCGEKGEETEHWYYRCPQDLEDCSIITFVMPRNQD